MIRNATPVPNGLFDKHLRNLKASELKVLLVVIRYTLGWKQSSSNQRKQRAWIANSNFIQATGLSNKSISHAITSLQSQGLIKITNEAEQELSTPQMRSNRGRNFYTLTSPKKKKLPQMR